MESAVNDLIKQTARLIQQLPGLVSMPGEDRYGAATAIWAKPVDLAPIGVVHCRRADDVQAAIRAARELDVPLSVRGGGHDWAGRALCNGIVIDLGGMRDVFVAPDRRTALVSGGALASDVAVVTDPLGLAVVAGSVGSVGMAGPPLRGGLRPLIGRFRLAPDHLLETPGVLAGRPIRTPGLPHHQKPVLALAGRCGKFSRRPAAHVP